MAKASSPNRSNAPGVSVVMPVHNALPHLDAAVESVLAQSRPDFEFVILDDASTDGSTERLREWAARDPRIRLLEEKRNLGPALSSDRVARAASGAIVARMDADDISYPHRLRDQLEILRRNPDVGLVASLCDIIDKNGRMIRNPEAWRLARATVFVPFPHGAIMYRRGLYDRVGGYRRQCEFWEDQDLVTRMAAVSKVAVIPRALYQVRQSTTSTRVASQQERLERAVDLMYRSLARLKQGKSYDDLLDDDSEKVTKLDPWVFVSLGSVMLWAGGKPRLFRRLLRKGKLSFDFRTLSAMAWTAWASFNPSSLRAMLLLLLKARNRFAVAAVPAGDSILWSPSATIAAFEIEPRALPR
jgi:glycosyltransferase involved in cell wall biosynthesis